MGHLFRKLLTVKTVVVGLFLAHPAVVSTAASAKGLQAANIQISPLEQAFFNSGKIYVVVAVAGVILIGIFVYLIQMERSLRKLEKELNERIAEK